MKPAHGAVATIAAAAALTLGVTQLDQSRARNEPASAVIVHESACLDSSIPKANILGLAKRKPAPAPQPVPTINLEPAPEPLPAPTPSPQTPSPVPMNQITVISWVDGDTFHGTYRTVVHFSTEIAMPWSPKEKIDVEVEGVADIPVTVRCYGIDTPETKGTTKAAGIAAREYAKKLAPPGTIVTALPGPRGQEKYGRFLADMKLPDGRKFSEAMIAAEHAVVYFGGAR